MTVVTFAKVTALPATPANSAMYFVPTETTGTAKAYITSSAGVPWEIAPLTSIAPPLVSSAVSLVGSSDNYARADHSHGIGVIPATATCSTQAAGNSSSFLASTAFVTAADNLKANIASPTFTGVPAAPTATAGTNTTQVATTAFVTTANNLKANIASPTFTGVPAAPTAATGTNTTQVATTAFVAASMATVTTNWTTEAW